MTAKIVIALAGGLLATTPAFADASYQDTTQITGGSLVDAIKSVPFLPSMTGNLFEPITSQVMVHGNQLASVAKASTEIIDLDAETITRLDHERKTYTVTTFQQLRDAMKEAPKKIDEAKAKMKEAQNAPTGQSPDTSNVQATFEVSLKDPNVSKLINGVMAKEQILTTKVIVTDTSAQAGNDPKSITYYLLQEIWTAPEPAEMKAIDDFYRRYAQTIMKGVDAEALMKSLRPMVSPNANATIFASQPGVGTAMAEAMKKAGAELAKIQGVRILEVSRFGGEAAGTSGASNGEGASAPASSSSGSATSGVTGAVVASAASAAANSLGALGSAAQSLFGAFGRSSTPPPPPPPPVAPPPAGSSAPSGAVLYESTTQKSQFSTADVPALAFAVPAGYAKVESPGLK